MTREELINRLSHDQTTHIRFGFTDIDGILRGKTIHVKKFLAGLDDGYGFCDVVFGWDSHDDAYPHVEVTGWQTGFPDKPCYIDLSTFRQIPWDNNRPFFIADFSGKEAATALPCPRSLLKQIASQCSEMGYHPQFAQEFEWFNFAETPQSLAAKQHRDPQPLTPGMFGYSILRPSSQQAFYNDLLTQLDGFGITVEGLHTETGPGVYEAAIEHEEIILAADQAALLKTAVKEIGYRHGIMASFMAKWNADLPGCSGHIHQSLWNLENTENLFFHESDPLKMSELQKQYVAGQLHCLPYLLPMYAPTINSYKRLVEGAWAPTTVTWGVENRTTAIRIINPSEVYARVETRIPGSDSNPYLAMAAALASGLYGIKNKLELNIPATIGNGYDETQHGVIPRNLYDATIAMQGSSLATELFGKAFTDHFTATRLWECRLYASQVSDWEIKRYFEII